MSDRSDDCRFVPAVLESNQQRKASRAEQRGDAGPFAEATARLLHDLHFEDVKLLDVRGLNDVTDYVLIASGTSNRQIKSIRTEVDHLGREMGFDRFGYDEDDHSTWLVLDYVDVIVHLFEPTTRLHYDLEMMWGDAPVVRWQR